MTSTPDAIAAVSQRLETFFQQQHIETAEFGAESTVLLDAAARACAGGKRLRARFLIAGWRAVAEASSSPVSELPAPIVAAAAALEVFHAAALVHDDIVDNSDTRRGSPAAHRAMEAFHREAGWAGEPGSFGRSAAILLGDLLVAGSDDLFEDALSALAPGAAQAARAEYARMRRDVTIGQFLDVAEESAFRTAPDDEHAERALRVASLKSARYSVQQPLLIGAALAGADPDQAAALRAFGHPVGIAFQLRDDVLGVFGDQVVTGKPSGDDLREGKRTVLVAYMRERLDASTRRLVDELLGDPELDAGQISMLQRTIVDTGALERVEALISSEVRDADRALSGARLAHSSVSALRDLARAATVRDT